MESLATAPPDADGCLALHYEGVTDARKKAIDAYVARNGYFPEMIIDVRFVKPEPRLFSANVAAK